MWFEADYTLKLLWFRREQLNNISSDVRIHTDTENMSITICNYVTECVNIFKYQ